MLIISGFPMKLSMLLPSISDFPMKMLTFSPVTLSLVFDEQVNMFVYSLRFPLKNTYCFVKSLGIAGVV